MRQLSGCSEDVLRATMGDTMSRHGYQKYDNGKLPGEDGLGAGATAALVVAIAAIVLFLVFVLRQA